MYEAVKFILLKVLAQEWGANKTPESWETIKLSFNIHIILMVLFIWVSSSHCGAEIASEAFSKNVSASNRFRIRGALLPSCQKLAPCLKPTEAFEIITNAESSPGGCCSVVCSKATVQCFFRCLLNPTFDTSDTVVQPWFSHCLEFWLLLTYLLPHTYRISSSIPKSCLMESLRSGNAVVSFLSSI